MPELLEDKVCQKIIELRRVYGMKGIADLLNVKEIGCVKVSDITETTFDSKIARRIKSGVRLYWKSWMAELEKPAE
jgi:hypothetical protein